MIKKLKIFSSIFLAITLFLSSFLLPFSLSKYVVASNSTVFGDGSDGSLTISTDTVDNPIDSPTSGTAGTNTLYATNVSFAAGQQIMIHQTRGLGAGTWEKNKIVSYSAGTIATEQPLQFSYSSSGSNDRAQVLVLKQYTNVTVNSGITWSAKPWDGATGGILVFLANGTLTNNGTISASGRGFRGGKGRNSVGSGLQGEGTVGASTDFAPQANNANGNGGGGSQDYEWGAGGGGNGTAGADGASGNTNTSKGYGGNAVGSADLTTMDFGGGGGGTSYSQVSPPAANGGNGGGIIFITAVTLTNSGTISSAGSSGQNHNGGGGAGGGGAGGSVLLKTQIATGTSLITVPAGTGGVGGNGPNNYGGNGGDGRIHIEINQPPTANAGGPYSVSEGGSVGLIGSGSDPDGDPITFAWDLDNNGTFETSGQNVTFSAAGRDGPSSQTVVLRVCDNKGACTTSSATVNIINVPPTATFASIPATINEGAASTLSFSNQFDPSAADVAAGFRYSYDCTNDGVFELTDSLASSYSCSYPDNGVFTVRGRIKDKDGGFTDYLITVTVNNVAPTVGAITAPTDPLLVNSTVNTSATFTDPGVLDTHTAVWSWGDATTSSGTVTETNGSGSVTGSHTYTAAGVYTLTLTVTDKDGASGQSIFRYVVIFDSTAGFVTGAGMINSPTGAFPQDPSLTGQAKFGFSVKYLPGDTVPNGGSQFHFKLANIDFVSTSYQWLVISGSKATFKGVGTNNGSGNYTFLVSAIDGTPDRYRIKITDNTTNTVFYDNEMGSSETADPTTPLVVGNIVIH